MSEAEVLAFSIRARRSGETAAEKDSMTKLQLFRDVSSRAKLEVFRALACGPSRQVELLSQGWPAHQPMLPELLSSCNSLPAERCLPAAVPVPTQPSRADSRADQRRARLLVEDHLNASVNLNMTLAVPYVWCQLRR